MSVKVESGMKVSVNVFLMIAENREGWSLLHCLFIASVSSFSVEIKECEWILARHSVNKLTVSAVILLEGQMTGVAGGGGHVLVLVGSCTI